MSKVVNADLAEFRALEQPREDVADVAFFGRCPHHGREDPGAPRRVTDWQALAGKFAENSPWNSLIIRVD